MVLGVDWRGAARGLLALACAGAGRHSRRATCTAGALARERDAAATPPAAPTRRADPRRRCRLRDRAPLPAQRLQRQRALAGGQPRRRSPTSVRRGGDKRTASRLLTLLESRYPSSSLIRSARRCSQRLEREPARPAHARRPRRRRPPPPPSVRTGDAGARTSADRRAPVAEPACAGHAAAAPAPIRDDQGDYATRCPTACA